MKTKLGSKLGSTLGSLVTGAVFCFSAQSFDAQANTKSRWSGDWFEIEVIVLAHLNDKNNVHEKFDPTPLSIPRNARDLLAGYLQPNIATLKQQLPNCKDPVYPPTAIERGAILPYMLANLTAEEISALPLTDELYLRIEDEHQAKLDEIAQQQALIASQEASLSLAASDSEDDFFDRVTPENVRLSDTTQDSQNNNQEPTDFNQQATNDSPINTLGDVSSGGSIATLNQENLPDALLEEQLTEEQLVEINSLVLQAEHAFPELPFVYNHLQQKMAKTWCAISNEEFIALNTNPERYSYHGYNVDEMPTRIDNAEDLYASAPYLISKNSLQLADIFKKMRLSKHFRPMLHFGWRQQVFEENRAIPMRLYAGDNLALNYLLEQSQFEKEQQQALEQERILQEALQLSLDSQSAAELDSEQATVKEQAFAIRVQDMIEQVEQINPQTPIEQVTAQAQPLTTASNQLMFDKSPIEPLQPWFIDGLLKVYLVGNYLHVDADVSVVDKTLAEQATHKLTFNEAPQLQTVRLTQSRRMISRETHFFDHPYMGIVVQIRRHDRPKPKEALVSEVE